jgi:hypothetical protein
MTADQQVIDLGDDTRIAEATATYDQQRLPTGAALPRGRRGNRDGLQAAARLSGLLGVAYLHVETTEN